MTRHGTQIEWTHVPGFTGESWNPLRARNRETGGIGHFCEHMSEGCRNCYAERLQPRFRNFIRYARQDRAKVETFLDETQLMKPLHWRAPRAIFVCSMTDLFGEWVSDDEIDSIFAVAALCPQHIFIVLTKRPERMRQWYEERWQPASSHILSDGFVIPAETHGETRRTQIERACEPLLETLGLVDTEKDELWTEDGKCKAMQWAWPLPNVWIGVSVEDQKTADARIPDLLKTPAAIRFASYEPALGPVDFENIRIEDQRLSRGYGFIDALSIPDHIESSEDDLFGGARLNQIIMGGESGPGARPLHPDWARSVRDQCYAADVPFFFKQWGEWAEHHPINPSQGDGIYLDDDGSLMTMPLGGGYDRAGLNLAGMRKIGKHRAGRLLDGIEHNGFPEIRA